jgi:hypothetical protein
MNMAAKSANNLVVNEELELLKQETRKFAQNVRSAREILEEINELMILVKQLKTVQS